MSIPQPPVPADFDPSACDDDGSLSLRRIFSVVRQRLPVAIAVFLVAALATFAYVLPRKPSYTTESHILIQPRNIDIASGDTPGARSEINPRDLIKTQIQILESTPVLKQVLQTGIFDGVPSFAEAKDPIAKLAKMIDTSSSGFTVTVSVTHEDPRLAVAIVDSLVNAYLAESRSFFSNVNRDAIDELKAKSEEIRVRLDAEENALQAFMEENDLGSFDDTKLLVGERYQEINKNLADAEALRIAAETQYETARGALESGSAIESIPGVLESPIISTLKLELAMLQRQEGGLPPGGGDPSQQAAPDGTAALQAQIRAEAERIVEGLRGRFEQLKGEEALLREALAEQKKQVSAFNNIDVQYRRLRQSRDLLQEVHDSVIRRIDELDANNLSGLGASAFVIAPAEIPTVPSSAGHAKMLAIGLFFAFVLAIGACFILDYFDTTVKTADDVHSCGLRPFLGSVPAGGGRKKAAGGFYAIDHPHSAFAEAFRTIFTRLSFSASGSPLRSLVVSSAGSAEGKSLCALNLAIAAAQSSKRVLLVDADLRTPVLAEVFPGAPAKGLADLLAGDSESLASTVAPTPIPNLSFLPAGTLPPNPVALLDSPRFAELLRTLSSQCDLVVFDAPACLDKVDALLLAKQAGGLVYVLRASASGQHDVQQAVRQLDTANVPVLGAILNDASA